MTLIEEKLHQYAETCQPPAQLPITTIRDKFEQSRMRRNKRTIRLTASALILFALLSFILLTPQGKALAQTVIGLFTNAEKDVVSLREADANHFLKPAIQGLSLEDASKTAGLAYSDLPLVPAGYQLDGRTYYLSGKILRTVYKYNPYNAGEMFIHDQSPNDIQPAIVGKSANVENFELAGYPIAYVEGAWVFTRPAGMMEWEGETNFHTYRWEEEGIIHNLSFVYDDSDSKSPAWLSEQIQKEIIEGVLGLRTSFSPDVFLNRVADLETLEKLAGFKVMTPAYLPDGYALGRFAYDEKGGFVELHYSMDGSENDSIIILAGKPGSLGPELAVDDPDYSRILVEGDQAFYWAKIYPQDKMFATGLRFKLGGLDYIIRQVGEGIEVKLAQADLVKMAESMK